MLTKSLVAIRILLLVLNSFCVLINSELCGEAMPQITPQDSLGPFYVPATPVRSKLAPEEQLANPENVLHVEGQVLGNDCVPMQSAMVEPWYAGQADAQGNEYSLANSPELRYRGTMFTDSCGYYNYTQTFPISYSKRPIHHVHFRLSSETRDAATTTSTQRQLNSTWRELLVTQMYFRGMVPNGYYPDITQIVSTTTNEDGSRSVVFNIYVDQPGTADVHTCGFATLPEGKISWQVSCQLVKLLHFLHAFLTLFASF